MTVDLRHVRPRYAAHAAAAARFTARRSIFAGVVCGEIVMLVGTWLD
jgi:hypothetical protein